MARLPIVDTQSATGSNKQIFDTLQKNLGTVPNMTRVMANSPAVLLAYAQFSGALAGGSLPARVREQIALLAAETNACDYCLSAHSTLGKLAGLTQEQIDGARNGNSADKLALGALKLAQSVLTARGGIAGTEIEAARAAGLTDAQIAEVVAAVGLNVFTNYFNRAFDVDVDFPRVTAHQYAAAR